MAPRRRRKQRKNIGYSLNQATYWGTDPWNRLGSSRLEWNPHVQYFRRTYQTRYWSINPLNPYRFTGRYHYRTKSYTKFRFHNLHQQKQ